MSLKKNLEKGQASLEYFILFAVIAILTLVSLSTFYPQVKNIIQGEQGFFQRAAGRISK